MGEAGAAPAEHSRFQPDATAHHRAQLGNVFNKGQKHETNKKRNKEKSDSSADTKKKVWSRDSPVAFGGSHGGGVVGKVQAMRNPCKSRFALKAHGPWEGSALEQGRSVRRRWG